jgi:predicted dehydrogenase
MMVRTKIGIVGTGRMGSLHLSKYLDLPEVELVGVYEPNPDRAREIKSKYSVTIFSKLEELIFMVDGLVIASPTPTHFSIAKGAIESGVHVLIEKPFCETEQEAEHLELLSRQKSVICQIGFLERFRMEALLGGNGLPQEGHLECQRLSSVVGREPAVDVVSDLMVHDLDLVLSVTKEQPNHIEAEGFSVVTNYLDFAVAKLQFPNGWTAQLTASRIAPVVTRRFRAVSNGYFCEIDFVGNTKYSRAHNSAEGRNSLSPDFDALEVQAKHFISAIRHSKAPKVSATDGKRIVSVTRQIREKILGSHNVNPHQGFVTLPLVEREN